MKRTIEILLRLVAPPARLVALLFAVCATSGAWAAVPVPTAIWDGNFNTTRIPNWTLSANGNTVATDGSTITITKQGLTLTPSATIPAATGVTVLVKMSDISTNNDNDQILVCTKQNNVGVMAGISMCRGARTLHGAWNGTAKWDSTNNGETSFAVPSSGDYYILFTSGNSSSTVREGFYEVGGTVNIKEITGLRDSSNAIQMITIGGRPAVEGERADNAVVKRILVYKGCLTSEEMKSAIDDIEGQSIIYNLAWQADGNKGALDYANFMLPSSSYFMACGSASLNSSKALRSITIPWRPDSTVNSGGATSLYLAVTDSNNKLLALSSAADMSTVAIKSSTTFNFTQAYISDNTQYRYWFISSNNYNLGDTISVANRMGCSLYNIGSAVGSINSNTMDKYTPASWIWCSNMTESEFVATSEGTAVATSDEYADDITLKGVAEGKFTIGELNAARITLADADVTIELDADDSIKAQYIDNSSQKLVIDASNAATAVGTYTIFEGNLASTDAADFEVIFPTLASGSGDELYTTVTDNKISYQVDRTAVSATLTLTSDTSFSAEKTGIDWMDSNHSSLEIVNNEASPITLTIDEDITAGSITVSGTGTTIIERGNSAVITATTVTVPAGSTLDATGSSITTFAGDGTFIWTTGYPTTVPAGMTYKYVGSDDVENPAVLNNATVSGTLLTSGQLQLRYYSQVADGAIDVLSGCTKLGSRTAVNGTVTVRPDAELVFTNDDAVNYSATTLNLNIYGTLTCGAYRQSIPTTARITFYTGSTITGSGDGNAQNDSTFDLLGTADILTFSLADGAENGTVNFNAPVSLRGSAAVTWTVDSGVTVDWAGDATKGCTSAGASNCNGSVKKAGAGTLKLSGVMNKGSVTLNAGTLDVAATQAVAVTSTSSGLITSSNSAVVTGTVTLDSYFSPTALASFLQSSAWQGTLVIPSTSEENGQILLGNFGNAKSYIQLNGITADRASASSSGNYFGTSSDTTIAATVKLGGTVKFNNGWSGKTYKFTRLAESSGQTLSLDAWVGAQPKVTYEIGEFYNFDGTVNLVNRSTHANGCELVLNVGNIVATAAYNTPLVAITTSITSPGTGGEKSVTVNLANATLNGSAANLVYDTDGIYLAAATYGGVNYATLQAAIEAAGDENLADIVVADSSAEVPEGYALVGGTKVRKGGGEIYWVDGTYWAASGGSAVFSTAVSDGETTTYVAGDTVVIPDNTKRWYGPISDGAKIVFSCGETIYVEKTGDLGYAFKNADITIESGTTVNFVQDGYGTNPEVNGGSISGEGAITVANGATLDLSGVVELGITPSGGTVNVASGAEVSCTGSATISSTLAGSGEVSFATLPASALTLGDWTGTVELPVLAANQAYQLNNYGKTGSTIRINGLSAGWLAVADQITVNANLELAGDWNLSAMSTRVYTFATVSGTGNMSFATAEDHPTSINIDTLSGYTGTITNNTEATLTIGTLALGSVADVSAGAKLLSTGGTGSIVVSSVTVGGEAADFEWESDTDGVYVKALIDRHVGYVASYGGLGNYIVVTNTSSTVTLPTGTYLTVMAVANAENSATIVLPDGTTLSKGVSIYPTNADGTINESLSAITDCFTLTETTESGSTTKTFTLKTSGTVTVATGEDDDSGNPITEAIPVIPEVRTDGIDAPMTANADAAPVFSVKTIPGLWYAIEESSSPDTGFAVNGDTATMATSVTTTLPAASAPVNGVKYYKIAVGASQAALQ